ncbi:MAG: mechanosensitive ion channel family protein [Pseudomonadota bacterium]
MLNKVLFKNITILELIVTFIVLAAAVFISKAAATYMRRTLKDKIRKDNLEIFIKVLQYAIISFAIVYALGVFGFNLSGLMVAGGIAGMVLGFASQRIVGNFISGIFLIIERPIKIGDQVQINDHSGFVEDIRILATTIRTYEGLYIRIPNEKIFTSDIVNYVHYIIRRFKYVVSIRYTDDADTAILIIKNVVDDHPLALKNPAPVAFVESLGEKGVNIVVMVWAPGTEWNSVKMELLCKIKAALSAGGIAMPPA